MDVRQKQLVEMYGRVQAFLVAHPLDGVITYGDAKQSLDDVVQELAAHRAAQLSGARFGRAEAQQLAVFKRELVELHMRPIVRIAKAKLAGSPGIDQVVRMPRVNGATTMLLAEATVFHAAAQKYEDVFVRNGCPPDFLAQLNAVADKVRTSQDVLNANAEERTGGSAGLKDELKEARRLVEILDGTVRRAFVGNASVLAEWRNARRVRGVAGGRNTEENGATAGTSAVTQPAASSPQATDASKQAA
ncbi:MAG TPA: hypothetical protein VJ867_12205 [Gemmatimonadaceae bacterium]|nr:hypothetical protein [Gemmatimonadaceae bacterium]